MLFGIANGRQKHGESIEAMDMRCDNGAYLIGAVLHDKYKTLSDHTQARTKDKEDKPVETALSQLQFFSEIGLRDKQAKKVLNHYSPLCSGHLESFNQTVILRTTIREELKTRLKVTGLTGQKGKAIGARIDVTEVIKYLITHYQLPEGTEIKCKFTLDGRPNGKKGELSVGLVPFFSTQKLQSANNVFPLAILQGKL
jgi:hypothetical protein